MTVLRNRDCVLVDESRTAHRPAPMRNHTACGAGRGATLYRMKFVQALVYVKPTWCSAKVCFPGGVS